jgi:plasmid stability protein
LALALLAAKKETRGGTEHPGRSMEAEIRAILTAAVSEPDPSRGLFVELMERFGEIGGGGEIVSARERSGMPIDGFEAQIASICRRHAATLATRNLRNFAQTGVDIVDPWREVMPDAR